MYVPQQFQNIENIAVGITTEHEYFAFNSECLWCWH